MPFFNYFIGYRSNKEEVPLWSGGIDKCDVGNFDSFGAYLDNSIESSLEPENEKDFNFDFREISQKSNFGIVDDSTRNYQWIYRDPTGIIQGPFTALEMQGWYEAGFFENFLLVKREDVNFFESLDDLILKVNNCKIPFLSPWPPTTNNLDTFNLKTTTQQPPFGNPTFLPSALPRVSNRSLSWGNNHVPLSSPSPSSFYSSSWLSSQNGPLYNSNNNNTRPHSVVGKLSQRDNIYGKDAEHQQLAMNQQMEQQYLSMLHQNQQHHFQLQQRMVQQQQQQQQQQLMFINTQNYERIVSPTVSQQSINRGCNYTPGTPSIINIAQNSWCAINKQDEPFFPSPHWSRSPSKTQVEEETQLAFTLNSMSIVDNEISIESLRMISTLTNDNTITIPSTSTSNTNVTNTNVKTIELTKQRKS
ncbi:MAG: GYF domain-containing protein [Paenibacillus sp.]|nr:GYF domain-containing protein [Paenibacillus sp.]